MEEKKERKSGVWSFVGYVFVSLEWRNMCYMGSFFAEEHAMIFRELRTSHFSLGQVLGVHIDIREMVVKSKYHCHSFLGFLEVRFFFVFQSRSSRDSESCQKFIDIDGRFPKETAI